MGARQSSSLVPRPVRALVVGAGETSVLMHLPVLAGLRDRGRLALIEVCDLRADRAAAARERFGFGRSGGDALSAVRRPDIDAVYLFGDARLHHDLGLAALQAGKHLFVEKPVAPSHAQALELAEAARGRGLIAAGGHNRRFFGSLQEVRRRGGKAGWRSAEAVFHKPAAGVPPPFGASSWLTANAIHALDALLFVMGGLPEQLTALAERERFSALMRWPDGAQGVFLSDNAAGERREAYAFHAPGESCCIDDAGLRIASAGSSRLVPAPAFADSFEAEHAAFLDAIVEGAEPPNGLAALAPSLRLAELIESGFSGRIPWPERPGAPPRQKPAGGSLLLVNPAGLTPVFAARSPGRPLVAFEDVLHSPRPRPDVVAAVLGTGPSVLTAEVLDKLPNLRVAGLVGLSFERHNPDLLLDRGVALVNASAAHADSVAEFAFGLAILGRRRAFASDRFMRRGGWGTLPQPRGWRGAVLGAARALRPALARAGLEPALLKAWRGARPLHGLDAGPASPPRDLSGATVGLIGWGASARALTSRLLAAGAKVIVFSERASADEIQKAGAAPAHLGEALAADIVSLHRALNPATRHGLGAAELARLRPGSVLINVARAALIEPEALLARLKTGDVFACLDVFEHEPPPASDPLRRLPNVFLTSHIAGGSTDMRAAAVAEVLHKIERQLAGEPGPPAARPRAPADPVVTMPAPPALAGLWRRGRFELRRRLRRPVAGRFQPYPHTLPDRYPWLFDFAAAALDGVPVPRLLSFGCSRGDEAFSLRRRFPDAAIKGIDIDPANIAACRARSPDDRLVFEAASNTRAEPAAAYDAIFCLAVLCHGDLTVTRAERSEPLLRFADFEHTVAGLDRCLKPGGLLFLHTTSFRFCDTALAPGFEVVLEAGPEQLAPDVLFDRHGRLMLGERYHPVGFRKRIAPG